MIRKLELKNKENWAKII